MRLSIAVIISDLIPIKQTFFERVFELFDRKHTIFQKFSHDSIFHALMAAGINGVELLIPSYATDKNIREVKKLFKKYNIPIVSIHQSLSNRKNISITEIERLCKISKELSATIIVLHSGTLEKNLGKQKVTAKYCDTSSSQ